MKTCTKCGQEKSASEFWKTNSKCKECRRIDSRERMKEFRQTDDYRAWLDKSRDRRNALKAKYRIQSGCKIRKQITEEHTKRVLEAEKKRADREYFNWCFIGPPKPSGAMNGADYRRWKYRNNQHYRNYHLDKRRRNVETVTTSYAREQLGIKDAPAELVEAKRLFILIKRQIKECTQ